MSTSHNLLGASDLLSISGHLIEAIFMAACDLSDKRQIEAIQQVCIVAQKHITDASEIIHEVRKGGLS